MEAAKTLVTAKQAEKPDLTDTSKDKDETMDEVTVTKTKSEKDQGEKDQGEEPMDVTSEKV